MWKFSTVLGLFLIFTSAVHSMPKDGRIVGGATFKVSSRFDSLQVLVSTYVRRCGGIAVIGNYVLTSGSCFDGVEIQTIEDFVLGQTRSSSQPGESIYGVENIMLHEDYNPETSENDVALIKISEPFIFPLNVKPISLSQQTPPSGSTLQIELPKQVSLTGSSLPVDSKPRYQKIRIDRCEVSDESMICGFSPDYPDACQIYTGTPVFNAGTAELAGIVSSIAECDTLTIMNIAYYSEWINNNIN